MEIMFQDILYAPGLWVNSFSITKAIENPTVKLSKDKELIKLKIGQKQHILFDKIFKCGSGQVVGVDIKPTNKVNTTTSNKNDVCVMVNRNFFNRKTVESANLSSNKIL
jgi:hypothetical protein